MNNQQLKQRGFAFLPFLLANWQLIAIAGLGLAVLGYYKHCESVKEGYRTFVAKLEAQAQDAENAAKSKEAQDRKLKESVDRENEKLRAANAALSRSLRESRASRGFVPPASPGSANPTVVTFDRAELERAIQRLDEGVSGLIAEGSQAVADLDSAKRWAAER